MTHRPLRSGVDGRGVWRGFLWCGRFLLSDRSFRPHQLQHEDEEGRDEEDGQNRG